MHVINTFKLIASNHCNDGSFLGFPHWYKYIKDRDTVTCAVQLTDLSNIWQIAAAIFELLLRVSALIAVIFIIVGSIQMIAARGEPESIKHAKGTITNAIIGLVVAMLAATLVSVIAGSL